MFQRHLGESLVEALRDSPVTLLVGARQTGKSTLARSLIDLAHRATYLTLDDATTYAAASEAPAAFLAEQPGPLVIDEIQRAPGMFRAIKAEVDRRREPGRFFLTGSADVLLLPRLSESLAGRMEVLTLWPFSQGEMNGVRESFLDTLFSKHPVGHRGRSGALQRTELLEKVLGGGYPP